MSERMLVTQALDERDHLVKKIGDKIEGLYPVDIKRNNKDKTEAFRSPVQEFSAQAQSDFQRIMDLIKRYQRLDAALTISNAQTIVKASFGEISVAGAIALRNRIKGKRIYADSGTFEFKLIGRFKKEFAKAQDHAQKCNSNLMEQADEMRLSILGKDSKGKEEKPLDVVDAYIEQNTTEVIDPLDSRKKVQELQEKIDEMLSELDTLIKVANATTYIEF